MFRVLHGHSAMLAQRYSVPAPFPFSFAAARAPWPEPSATPIGCVREADPIDALADDALGSRFRSWRGRSGRRYVFSVFDAVSCPAYCDAVLVDVAVDEDGRRRALAFVDTGTFPEPVMSALTRSAVPGHVREFHVHLLARDAAERRALLDDLRGLD
jgi:hypothetical protein